MSIGTKLPGEIKNWTDDQTGRTICQFTSSNANSYPLYYFIPTITADNRYLVLHSERGGWVQLYRMDLQSGEMIQLTDGHTRDAGWAIWCEYHLRGIFNHISALDTVRSEVFYFQDDEIRGTHVLSLENRLIRRISGRISIGQTSFSPDGSQFAFIHADHDQFRQAVADREALANMHQPIAHQAWRNALPVTIGIIDTKNREYRDVIKLDYHVHHVLFIDNDRLLVNHPRNEMGMWMINTDGTGFRHLRPGDGHGAVCHQVITPKGILYEAYNSEQEGKCWFGRYDLSTHAHQEVFLPDVRHIHTGNDPAGEFLFCDSRTGVEDIFTIHYPRDPKRFTMRRLRRLNKMTEEGQRHHCHPFLGPDRKTMYWTEVIEGFSQICSTDVSDLIGRNDGWDAA